jgi:3',5'-cyclic AMP phosphodiesterase CpdA
LTATFIGGFLALAITVPSAQEALRAPSAAEALHFAVLGDNGTGDTPQYDIGRQMAAAYARAPFDFVVMLGDNMYGRQEPSDFIDKFERPYQPLLAKGVRFFATLGNHDQPDNRSYPPFNMNGERYYTYVRGPVRFVVLDTNELDPRQVDWADRTLTDAREGWKIVYFHHPLYSSGGRHGSNVELRVLLEPLLTRTGVQAVFSGHDHHYERFAPQKGITYFVAGSGGKLRKGNTASPETARLYDAEQAFMTVDVAGETLSFHTISRSGRIVDSGAIRRRPTT